MEIRWLTAFLDFPAEQFGAEVTFWRAIAGSTVSPPRGEHREFASLEPF
ncbi:VOC family protein, partial [Streptomyces sp. SID10244]|nr:VOC family protein [Streptomyces sp. SID10244]